MSTVPITYLDDPGISRNPEIIEGILRTGNIVTMCGPFNLGKSPLLQTWGIAVTSGQPWCGRKTAQRPVIMLDFETQAADFRPSIRRIAAARKVNLSTLPLHVYIDRGLPTNPLTVELRTIQKCSPHAKLRWLESLFERYPRALLIIDPIQMLFNVDKNKSTVITGLYLEFRAILDRHPESAIVLVFNFRKKDPRGMPASLLEDPRRWLEDTAGSLDIQNRSDVRLGVDQLIPTERMPLVVNGLRRGEGMEPLILEPAWWDETDQVTGVIAPQPAGFVRVSHMDLSLDEVLTPKMRDLWAALEGPFTTTDLESHASRSTAIRFRERCLSLGLLRETGDGIYEKME